jgi:hypothetical protein
VLFGDRGNVFTPLDFEKNCYRVIGISDWLGTT